MGRPALPQPTEPTGTHLYKYASQVDWLEDLLLEHSLYIPLVRKLNDPADCKPQVSTPSRKDFVKFLMRTWVGNHPSATKLDRVKALSDIEVGYAEMGADDMLKYCVEILDRHADERRVYSMSRRWDNMAMWAQYANNHRGYCIEFLNDRHDALFCGAREVRYDNSIELDMTDPSHSKTAIWLVLKDPAWSSEEEVRIVIPRGNGGPCFNLRPHLVTRVILGKDMPDTDAARVQEWATRRDPPIQAVRATYSQFNRRLFLA